MTLSIFLPILILIIGVLVYALAARPETKEMGRLAYACGLLVTLFMLATHVVRF